MKRKAFLIISGVVQAGLALLFTYPLFDPQKFPGHDNPVSPYVYGLGSFFMAWSAFDKFRALKSLAADKKAKPQ